MRNFIDSKFGRAGLLGLALLVFVGLGLWAESSHADGPVTWRAPGNSLVPGDLYVRTGNLSVGNGTPDVAQDGEDAYVEGTLEVDGATRLDSDLTVSADSTGGNAGARNTIIGKPQLKLVSLGTMTNGSTETTSYMDDTPDGEWASIDANDPVTVTASSSVYRVGTKSLQVAFGAAAAAGDGAQVDIVNDDLSSNESVGFWIRSSEALSAGDLVLFVDDTDTDTNINIPAVASADVWTWVEVNVSALDGTSGNVVDKIGVALSSAGATAHGAFTVQIDYMWKWDATDEEALGVDLVQDGVLSVATIATAAGSANTPADLVEGTGYVVHYESGNDFLVTVTDQSAASGIALVAYQ